MAIRVVNIFHFESLIPRVILIYILFEGPLVSNNTLIGVVSASIGCALGYPDLYTNIYEYTEWIKNDMTNNMVDVAFPKNLVEFFN